MFCNKFADRLTVNVILKETQILTKCEKKSTGLTNWPGCFLQLPTRELFNWKTKEKFPLEKSFVLNKRSQSGVELQKWGQKHYLLEEWVDADKKKRGYCLLGGCSCF